MEGRPAELTASGDALDERVDHLIALNSASRFRERLLVPTTFVSVAIMTLLAAAAAVTLARERTSRWGRYIAPRALVDPALFPASNLARGFPLDDLRHGFLL